MKDKKMKDRKPKIAEKNKEKFSAVGDLTPMVKELEAVFSRHFGGRPAMAFAFTLPPAYDVAHWATNLSRKDGIKILEETAQKMKAQLN
jgi:hypothetical protein